MAAGGSVNKRAEKLSEKFLRPPRVTRRRVMIQSFTVFTTLRGRVLLSLLMRPIQLLVGVALACLLEVERGCCEGVSRLRFGEPQSLTGSRSGAAAAAARRL